MDYAIGTEVKIRGQRGQTVVGVVAGEHYLRRKGRAREVAAIVTGNPDSLNRLLTVVVHMTKCEYYRVEFATPTGKKISADKARARLRQVKSEIEGSKADRRTDNYYRSKEAGLRGLEVGDPIEVQYRGGSWAEREFAGFVRSSGNVRYKQNGRTRTTSPQFVRVKK